MSSKSKRGSSRRRKALARAASQRHGEMASKGLVAELQDRLERTNAELRRANILLVSMVMDRGGRVFVPEPEMPGRWRLEADTDSTSEGVTLVLVEDGPTNEMSSALLRP